MSHRTYQYQSRAPGRHVKSEPWSFIALALGAGVTAGFLLRFKTLRKALGGYLLLRRFM
jgi:hypothetical protein